ncbi:MAG: hypothetical protein P8Y53_19745 [Pseudolabrys sp.]
MRGPIFRFLAIAGAGLILLSAVGAAHAGEPANVKRCLAYAATMKLVAPLPHARARLAQGAITIVALGSSSTDGFGTFDPSYPEMLKAALVGRHRKLKVTMINSGIALDTIPGNVGRQGRAALQARSGHLAARHQ